MELLIASLIGATAALIAFTISVAVVYFDWPKVGK